MTKIRGFHFPSGEGGNGVVEEGARGGCWTCFDDAVVMAVLPQRPGGCCQTGREASHIPSRTHSFRSFSVDISSLLFV